VILRHARTLVDGRPSSETVDLAIVAGHIAEVGEATTADTVIDVEGRLVVPALVNAHDHLDFSVFPPLGRPPYRNVYDWADDVAAGTNDAEAQQALAVPEVDRLFLGGLRNLLCGAVAVVHHNPFHRSLVRDDFPVRVLERYQFAHSPGLTPALRRTYRSTDRRIPWFIHLAEGVDDRCAAEMRALVDANVLRHNTVAVHGVALREEDAARLAAAEACVVWCPESNRHLYGATAPVAQLRAAGVRVGLGSDSPASGVRDALSNLAAARREAILSDGELIDLATRGSGEVARLPVGGTAPGSPADLLVVDSIDRLMEGDRRALALVMREGRPLLGLREWVAKGVPIAIDGEERALEPSLGARAASLLRRYPQARRAAWLHEVAIG
jgi:cytosine/adenosine deaminase-related metal-dependent hydrolase